MLPIALLLARVLAVLLLATLLATVLIRQSPGYGVSEEDYVRGRVFSPSRPPVALLPAYAGFLQNLLQGEWGISDSFHQPVRRLLGERWPATWGLLRTGWLAAWAAGLSAALWVTSRRHTRSAPAFDLLANACLCVPVAVAAILLFQWGVDGSAALALVLFPKIFWTSRQILEGARQQPYVLSALGRGVSEPRLLLHYILRPAASSLAALAAVSVVAAWGAVIPIEVLCDQPGIGQLAWQAALSRDLPLLLVMTWWLALLTLAANTLADLAGGKEARS